MSACLQITLKVKSENREAAAAVYAKYKQPFLDGIAGAKSKELLIRDEDVQVSTALRERNPRNGLSHHPASRRRL